eukprot:2499255-Pleurochrysis_carterae.AAC.2
MQAACLQHERKMSELSGKLKLRHKITEQAEQSKKAEMKVAAQKLEKEREKMTVAHDSVLENAERRIAAVRELLSVGQAERGPRPKEHTEDEFDALTSGSQRSARSRSQVRRVFFRTACVAA